MIFIMLLLLMLIFCSYALLIHLLSLTSYLVIIFLMIIFLWLEIKFFDLKEKNEQKSINRKLRKLFSDYKDDDFSPELTHETWQVKARNNLSKDIFFTE